MKDRAYWDTLLAGCEPYCEPFDDMAVLVLMHETY